MQPTAIANNTASDPKQQWIFSCALLINQGLYSCSNFPCHDHQTTHHNTPAQVAHKYLLYASSAFALGTVKDVLSNIVRRSHFNLVKDCHKAQSNCVNPLSSSSQSQLLNTVKELPKSLILNSHNHVHRPSQYAAIETNQTCSHTQ